MRIYETGEGRIPNDQLDGKTRHITLVVDQDGSLDGAEIVGDLKRFRDGALFLMSKKEFGTKYIEKDPSFILSPDISVTAFIAGTKVNEVPLPTPWIRYLFSTNLRQVMAIDGARCVTRYQRPEISGDDVLFVSPGSIFPLSMGSHQRMFDSILGMIEQGYNVDVVFPRQPEARQLSAEAALSLIAREVTGYKSLHGKLKGGVKRRRKMLTALSKILRVRVSDKPTFPELCQMRSSFWQRRCIEERLTRKTYAAIWVNYSWMMGQIHRKIRDAVPAVVCDTHDVQFYRNLSQRSWLEQWIFSDRYLRECELAQLRRATCVLAISRRDEALLKQYMPPEKVRLSQPSFDHYLTSVTPFDPRIPLSFGFIGTQMDANRDALKKVILDWWPAIHAHSPASCLRIAGSICLDPEVRSLALMEDQVELLGYVDDLHDFYRSINVLLSPVLVKGGLNFKNVETIVAGRHVFTTPAGAEALAPLAPTVVNDTAELPSLLRGIEDDPQADAWRRERLQAEALRLFIRADFVDLLKQAT